MQTRLEDDNLRRGPKLDFKRLMIQKAMKMIKKDLSRPFRDKLDWILIFDIIDGKVGKAPCLCSFTTRLQIENDISWSNLSFTSNC